MEGTRFNKAQLHLLQLMSHIKTDEELEELRQVISDYFADKAQKEIDRLWDVGVLNQEKLDGMLKEHLRTPYKH